MTDHLGTVATRRCSSGCAPTRPRSAGSMPDVTVSGYPGAFHTYASMTGLLGAETWPADDRPVSIGYFCHVHPASDPPPPDDLEYPAREHARLRADAVDFLRNDVHNIWPHAARDGDFRWDLLCGNDGADGGPAGADAHRRAVPPRQHRSVGPLRAVAARHGPLPAPSRRERLRQSRRSRATGSTRASTPAASRRRWCRASRPRTRCSAVRSSIGWRATTTPTESARALRRPLDHERDERAEELAAVPCWRTRRMPGRSGRSRSSPCRPRSSSRSRCFRSCA